MTQRKTSRPASGPVWHVGRNGSDVKNPEKAQGSSENEPQARLEKCVGKDSTKLQGFKLKLNLVEEDAWEGEA